MVRFVYHLGCKLCAFQMFTRVSQLPNEFRSTSELILNARLSPYYIPLLWSSVPDPSTHLECKYVASLRPFVRPCSILLTTCCLEIQSTCTSGMASSKILMQLCVLLDWGLMLLQKRNQVLWKWKTRVFHPIGLSENLPESIMFTPFFSGVL